MSSGAIFIAGMIYWVTGIAFLVWNEKRTSGYVTPVDLLNAIPRGLVWGLEVIAYIADRYAQLKRDGWWGRKLF